MFDALFGRKHRKGTRWQEQLNGDETGRYREFARQIAAFQARHSISDGNGRAVHRKGVLIAEGHLDILSNLPDWAAQGIFARPASYPVWVRLSNGAHRRLPDWLPDVRGFTLAVRHVTGEQLPDFQGDPLQCFLLINMPAFPFAGPDRFTELLIHLAEGPLSLGQHLFTNLGLVASAQAFLKLLRDLSRQFRGFAANTFYSVTPMQNGPYAVKLRLVPRSDAHQKSPASRQWGSKMAARLAAGEVTYELQLQLFENEKKTPIEDASVEWKTPFITVGFLTLPQQETSADAGVTSDLAYRVEQEAFSPWRGLQAHRPLGAINRARRYIYPVSALERHAKSVNPASPVSTAAVSLKDAE